MYDEITIQSAAMEYKDTAPQHRHDLRVVMDRQSELIGLTEIDRPAFREDVRLICNEMGYRPIFTRDPVTGLHCHEPILVREDIKVVSSRFEQIIEKTDSHGIRGIHTVRTIWKGNSASLSWAHWLTDWDVPLRQKQNLKLTRAMAARVRLEAARDGGFGLAWWGGDINWDLNDHTFNYPGTLLHDSGLLVAYNVLGRPNIPTHGSRTIDVVGHYRGDKRVTPIGAVAWTDRRKHTYTDHNQVEVTYEVKRK